MTRESNRRFHFLREIASGTFGSVYLAKESHSDGFSRLVAIKLLHRRWSESEEVTRRIRDEARLLGWLRHRNIVDVVDLTAIDGRTAVIMEYLEAADLKHIADHLREHGGTLPIRTAVQIAASVAGALDAAYNRPPYAGEKPLRVIHRDIKPSNVMVDDGGVVKVLDFGIARADFESRESSTADLQFGSVDYMPPERLFFEPETPASDVYSLGATFYEILALERLGKAKGRPDRHAGFVRDRLSFLRAMRGLGGKLAKGLESLIIAMLDYEHTERPSAARVVEVCRELSKLCNDVGLHDWAEASVPPIVRELQQDKGEASPLDGRVVVEDSSALRVRESGVASSFRAIPEPSFDTQGRPITPHHADRERRMGSAALEELGVGSPEPTPAQPVPTPAVVIAKAPAVTLAPVQPTVEVSAPAPVPEAPLAVAEVPVPRADLKPRSNRAPTASFIPRVYSTGAFPRVGRSRGRPVDGRRGGVPDTSHGGFPELDWDDEHEATALVDPELLASLQSSQRSLDPPPKRSGTSIGSLQQDGREVAPATSDNRQPPPPAAKPPPPAAKPPPPAADPPPPAAKPPPPAAKPPPPAADPPPPVEEPLVLPVAEPTPPVEEPLVLPVAEPTPPVEEPLVLPVPEPAPPVEEPTASVKEASPALAEPAPPVEQPVVLPVAEPAPPVEEPTASVEEAPLPVPATPPGPAAPMEETVTHHHLPLVDEKPDDSGLPEGPSEEPATPYALAPQVDEGVELDAFDDDEPTVMRPGDSLFAPPPPEPRFQPEVVAPVEEPAPAQPTAAVDRRPQPVAAPPAAPSRGGGSFLPSAFLLACAATGSLLGFVLFMSPSRALLARPISPSPVATPHEAPVEPAAVGEPVPVPEPVIEPLAELEPVIEPTVSADAPPEGVAEFVVLSDELRKLQVRCADANAAGASPLQVSLEGTSACTVTAIYNDRSRATAVLDAAAPGQRYDCFSDGANLCQAL